MRFENYRDGVFESVMQSAYYGNDEEREMVINALKMFMDIFDYDGFFYTYDMTKDEYDKYYKDTIKKYSENWHQFAMQEFERERKKNENQ